MERPEVVKLSVSEEKGEIRLGVRNGKAGLIAELCLELSEGVNITYLFVKESERRKGIGSMLLQNALSIIARSEGFVPVQASFLADESEDLAEFFEAQPNFTVRENKEIFTITADARKKSSRWKTLKKASPGVKEFFSLDAKQRTAFIRAASEEGFEGFVDIEDPLLEKNMCLAAVSDGKVSGAVFFRKHGKKELELSFLFTQARNAIVVGELLGHACKVADELYPDADIWFSAVTPEAAGMADGFFGDKGEGQTVCIATWNGWSVEELDEFGEMMAQ